MGDHSDSDSSPKSSSSSSAGRHSSPQRARAHSDESGSSDGVLVELPAQEARSTGADPDSGVLVNMPADDATSGETFEDAPDDLAGGGSRSARSLDESMTVIDYPEVSSVDAECRKYKEEREVFAREAVALRRMLQETVGQEASVSLQGEDTAETPLQSMLDDCSRLVLELRSVAHSREQQIESLHARVAEAEVSKEVAERSEQAAGRMLASIDAVVGQNDVSFEGADQDSVSILEWKISLLVERHRQVLMGIEQLGQVLVEVKPGFVVTGPGDHATIIGTVTDELLSSKRNEVDLQYKMNTYAEEKKALAVELEEVKAARDAANAEASKAKAEFEQMEHKLSTTKEKLSMAVTKGKSLVQHRDSLKQALAEKTSELENRTSELQKKSDALQEAERTIEELRSLLDEKSNEHEKCLDELRETYSAWEAAKASIEELNEANNALSSIQASVTLKDEILQRFEEVMSEATLPEDLLSLEMREKLGWLVEQKKIADMIFSEHHKVKDILSSVDIPPSVVTAELDSQISWLVNSLNQANDDAVRLHNESSDMLVNLAENESKLVLMHEEIDRLTIILLEEKQEKDILLNEHSELMSLYNAAVDKLSIVSSQNNELVKAFAVFSDVPFEGNDHFDTAKLVQQSLGNIQQRTKSSSIDGESFEKLQTLLYILDQESTLCKIILEEDMIDSSERSAELHKMTHEIYILKNEKDSLQTELERVEEKSSLLREKLSMAVKKGKGLVHEREGLKQVIDEKSSEIENLKRILDEKNSEIEKLTYAQNKNISKTENMQEILDGRNSEIDKLKHDLDEAKSVTDNLRQFLDGKNYEIEKLQHALDENSLEIENMKQALAEKNSEAKEIAQELDAKNIDIDKLKLDIESRESAITDLSLKAAHFEKLQADIINLNDEKVKLEGMLEEANVLWGTLADSISNIALPVDQTFEEPLEKISWIAQYIKETEVAKSFLDNELHKANEQITLNASRLSDAHSTISMLEDELSKLKAYISSSTDEKRQIQLHTTAVEEELEKTNTELAINANKLEDANTTIDSLQDELLLAKSKFSTLEAEKNDAHVKHQAELNALNAKLTKYLEELDKAQGNLHSHSTEHHGHLEKLGMLVMDDNLLSLMTEEFGKTISSLRDVGLIVKSMHEQLTGKGIQTGPVMQNLEFATLLSLPDYDRFVTERLDNSKSRKRNIDDISSFTTIVEQLSNQAEYFSGFFSDLSGYMNNNIMLVLRALQSVSNNIALTLEQHDTLKNELEQKDDDIRTREAELLFIEKDLREMSSKCICCIQQIKIIFDDMVDLDHAMESATGSSNIRSVSEGIAFDLKDEDAGDYAKVTDTLLSTVNTLKSESEKLSDIKGHVITSLDELKMRLRQAESAAETASQEHQLYMDRICMLEKDLKTLQDASNEMELKIREYQEREGTLKARELELMLLEQSQVTVDRGVIDAISKDQLETLFEKITKLDMSSGKSHLQREMATFSSPIDKLFIVIDEFVAFQSEVETLKYENEDLQLTVESYSHEIEQLRAASKNSNLITKELDSKSSELLEVTLSMERMIQRLEHLGGKDIIEDSRPTTRQALLSKLEKLIITSSTEAGNAKSTIQEMGAKLQSREKVVDELSTKVKMLEDMYHASLVQPEASKDRAFEASSSAIGSDMSEIEDMGPMGKAPISSVSTAAHARTMRKGSSDHLVLNIGTESERLISSQDSDDKGRIKSLHTSGLIPAQGKHIADRVDAIWVSGSQTLRNRPRARLGLMVYWIFLHLWLLGSIL